MTSGSNAVSTREPGSGVVATAQPRLTLSQRLWGLDWSTVLPWSFDGATLHAGTFEEALPFIAEHYPRIFDGGDRFYREAMTDAKRRFFDETDVFIFRDGDETAGVIAAHPSDWSTYYVRTFALLPEYREKRWCNDWATRIRQPLAAVGCQRWEAECSPANSAMMRLFARQRGLLTANVNSERFGQMVRFTMFLEPNAEAAYRRQFIFASTIGRSPQTENNERRGP